MKKHDRRRETQDSATGIYRLMLTRVQSAELAQRVGSHDPALLTGLAELAAQYGARTGLDTEFLRPGEVNCELMKLAEKSREFDKLLSNMGQHAQTLVIHTLRRADRPHMLSRLMADVSLLHEQLENIVRPLRTRHRRTPDAARLWLARELRDLLVAHGITPTRHPGGPFMSVLDYMFNLSNARRDCFELVRRVLLETPSAAPADTAPRACRSSLAASAPSRHVPNGQSSA